jgi:putative DNA primase/helicase
VKKLHGAERLTDEVGDRLFAVVKGRGLDPINVGKFGRVLWEPEQRVEAPSHDKPNGHTKSNGHDKQPSSSQAPAKPRGLTENEIIDQFGDALAREGITPHGRLIANGKIQRCPTAGKGKKNKSGRYRLDLYRLTDGSYLPRGGYQNYRTGNGWVRWQPDNQEARLTETERAEAKAWREKLQRQHEEEERQAREKAQRYGQQIRDNWSKPLSDDHLYLVTKGVLAHGLRSYKGAIVVPLVDFEGVLHTVQLIYANGFKMFLDGGRVKGCFHILGTIDDNTVVIVIAEGFATGATIHELTGFPVVLAMDAGNLLAVATAIRRRYPNAKLVFGGDDDWKTKKPDGTPYNTGRIKGNEAAQAVGGVAVFPTFGPGREDGQKDFNDMAADVGGDATRACLMRALAGDPPPSDSPNKPTSDRAWRNGTADTFMTNDQQWPEPKELPGGLAKVGAFESAFLPDGIAPFVMDIADRMQCPADLVAIPAVTALGTLIGRKCGVRPERNTDWTEHPNLWGCTISRPGLMKSPAMKSAMGPLYKLEAEAFKAFQDERVQYEADLAAYKLKRSVEQTRAKDAAKKGKELEYKLEAAPEEPQATRYATNDSSYQELGRMLAANSSILVTRDEVVSLLRYLDQEQSSEARGFYLTGWNGNSPYTFDRVGRGTTRVEAVCIGIIGCATPDAIGDYVRRAMAGGSGDDGLIQRFGLMVWPDQVGEWKNTDRGLNTVAREAAYNLFQQLSELGPTSVGEADPFGGPPFLRFDDRAIGTFLEWRTPFERLLRSDDLHPALTSHFAKYRKLVPALALINHLCTGERTTPIGNASLLKAIRFSEYLAGHARRVYGSRREIEVGAAKAILSRIRSGDLTEGEKRGFTARDIHQRDWSKLTDIEHIKMGLELLVDYDWIATANTQTGSQSGRPTVRYAINPRAHRK